MSAGEGLNSQLVDRKGRLWQERTVVVKREENGFGFTLTQEMPVFVDKVFNGSSAQKAGIHPKDRIIKVNGVSVVGHKHQDVVDMIKDSSHVTITVISKLGLGSNGSHRNLPPTEKPHQSNIEISPPRQLQELTLQSLRTMLHKQRKNYESLSVDYSKQRSDKLEKELRDCEGIIRILELEIAAKSPAIAAHIQTTSASVLSMTPDKLMWPSVDERTLRLLGVDGEGNIHGKPASPSKIGRTGSGDSSPRPNRAHTFSNGSILSPLKSQRSSRKTDVSDDGSDDDLSDEVDGASESGPFSSLQELKGNPAHLSVFLNYLFLSKDPKYLLFHLVASSYQSHCKSIDVLRQRGMDMYWTFFLDNSPLQLEVETSLKQRILTSLETEEVESKLRSVFVEARESLSGLIINDLGNYRYKRVLGLAGMFGDQLVSNKMSFSKQLDVATSVLASALKSCLDEKSASNNTECIKNQAIAACIATYLLEVLTSGSKTGSRLPSILEKIQPFTRGDILLKKGKQKKKTISRNGHSFQLASYKVAVNCDLCGRPLWGVVYHGYQCSNCEMNVHRVNCVQEVGDCTGQVRAKLRPYLRKSSLSRKQVINVLSGGGPAVDEMDKDANSNALVRREEEGSLPTDVHSSTQLTSEDSLPGELETHPIYRKQRNRATSDPKQVFPFQHAPVHHQPPLLTCAELADHPPKLKVERTQSERLQSKPESLGKQRSIEANTLSWGGGELPSADEVQLGSVKRSGSSELVVPEGKQQLADEDIEELLDDNIEEELIPWALVARREVVQNMKRYEVARQENIRELVYTERTHLHKLKMMKYMYKIPLQKQSILQAHQVEQLFPSLEELILFHSGLCADLKERVGGSSNQDTHIVRSIADVLLHRFDGAAGERLCGACSVFASNQAKADKLCKEWKRSKERFRLFLKTAESHPLSQRLTLTELMPIAWTRLTRYKLLIDNILHSYKKNWEELDEADKAEATQVETAIGCLKSILKHVNKQVKWSTNRQKLADYQSKLDVTPMEKSQHPIAQQFKNLDLSAEKRMLIHEGPLTWKIQHRKVVELHALLLTDVLVLLDRQEDRDNKERFILRTHSVESVSGTKEELSTVIRLKDCLLRTAAADRGGRTFLLVNNSNLMKLAQMYEFIAENPKEKKKWEDSIERAMLGTQPIMSPELPSSPVGEEYGRLRVGFSSHLTTREQLDKLDDDMKKLMMEKLDILRSIQVSAGHRSSDSTPRHIMASTSESPKEIIEASIEQTGEILSTVSHIMVPNPTKSIVAETQTRLTDIIHELQRNLSRLLCLVKDEDYPLRLPFLDLAEEGSSDALPVVSDKGAGDVVPPEALPGDLMVEGETGLFDSTEVVRQEWSSYHERLFAIGEGKEEEEEEEEGGASQDTVDGMVLPSALISRSNSEEGGGVSRSNSEEGGGISRSNSEESGDDNDIVAPPYTFSGDMCATPTPGDFLTGRSLAGTDSGSSTPRCLDSPSVESLISKASPLAVHHRKAGKSTDTREASSLAQPSFSSARGPSHAGEIEGGEHSPEIPDLSSQDTPSSRMLSILTSSQHGLRSSERAGVVEDIPDYSLTTLSSATSLSEFNCSEEGSDL